MKQMALLGATVFGIIGGLIPMLFGDNDPLSGWGILTSTVGGLFGIWAGVKLYKLMS